MLRRKDFCAFRMMFGIDFHDESVPMVQVPQPYANGMTLRQLKHIIVLRIAAFRWSNTFRLTCKPMESLPVAHHVLPEGAGLLVLEIVALARALIRLVLLILVAVLLCYFTLASKSKAAASAKETLPSQFTLPIYKPYKYLCPFYRLIVAIPAIPSE